jgi:CubicO group peptidase (beta-lactamase class C family)
VSLIAGPPAGAQNEAAPPASAAPPATAAPAPAAKPAPDAGEPKAPVPYSTLETPKAAAPPKPAARPTPASAAAPAAPVAPGVRMVAGARLQPGQAIPPAELAAFVDGQVEAAMRRQHNAGVAVAVVQNGQVLLKKGYGFASLAPPRPVDPDRTLFRLGSVSKTFTWIVVMKEVEAGRIRLDQPVNLYLPERVQVRDQGFDKPVRVIDLMAHTAGFEDRRLAHLVEDDPDYVRPLDLYLRQERPRRVRAPGEVAVYSSYGAALAGEAAAWVSGSTFERLTEQEIFGPLGMAHTTFREKRPVKAALPAPMPAALAAETADGFRWTPEGFARQPYEYLGQIGPAASASSTAGDMARYMLALLGNGQLGAAQVYGPRTAQAFRTPILSTSPGINGWAHGFRVEPLPGGRTGYGHEGGTLSFAANLLTVPDLGLGVFVAVNTASGEPLAADLPQAVVNAFYAAPAPFPRAGSPELAADGQAFAGRYLTTRRAASGLEGFIDWLDGTARVRVTPQGRLVTASGGARQVWTPEGAPGEGRFVALQGEERLAFRMSGGEAAAYQTGANTELFERISFWRSPDALGLFAGLTGAAAVFSLVGAALRNRRELRENPVQSRGSLIQNIQAGLWLASLAAFAAWRGETSDDPARLIFNWPGPLLVTASACALVAAVLTITTLFALPAVWRGGRRVDSWPILRRFAFTLTVLIYAVFAVLLARAGALSPWSS